MGKFLLLGLDGATFEMLDPMLQTGRLPVLARLLSEGIRGPLASTIPPVTCPAWPTMYTGRNPGAHGFTSFRVLEPGSLTPRTATLGDVPCPRLWTALNAAGIRTGMFNVPATYPAEPVEGFMVSGIPGPSGAPGAVQPVRLREDFARAFPDYDCNGSVEVSLFARRSKRKWIFQTLRRNLLLRKDALDWMLQREPVDFLWVVLEAIDRLSHAGYVFLAPGSDLYETSAGREVREGALELLETQDEVIAWIIKQMGPETPVMVVSDHGFAWTPRELDLCGWLVANGFLVPPPGVSLRRRMRLTIRQAVFRSALGRRLWRGLAGLWRRKTGTQAQPYRLMPIDWQRSKTWPATPGEYGIRINSTRLHPEGIVGPAEYDQVADALVEGLAALKDAQTGQPVFETVARAEKLYSGEFTARAPDILIVPSRHVVHRVGPTWKAKPNPQPVRKARELHLLSNHDSTGIFAAVGGPFAAGPVESARILDIMPTVLHAMGQAIPAELEGRVLRSAFREDYLSSHPVRRVEGAGGEVATPAEGKAYSAEEEEEITRRLKGLGYM